MTRPFNFSASLLLPVFMSRPIVVIVASNTADMLNAFDKGWLSLRWYLTWLFGISLKMNRMRGDNRPSCTTSFMYCSHVKSWRGLCTCLVMRIVADCHDNMVDGSPRRRCVSHSRFLRAHYCGEERDLFKSSGEQIWSLFGTNTKSLRGVTGPLFAEWLSNYSPSMMLLACAGTAETTVPTGKALTCCNSLPACKMFFLTRKDYVFL